MTLSKAGQALQTWQVATSRPNCLNLYLCRRQPASDTKGTSDKVFSIMGSVFFRA